MKLEDLSAQDVVHLILFDNTGNMYAEGEALQAFIRKYCAEGLCPDTEIVEDYAIVKSEMFGPVLKQKDDDIKRLGIENASLYKRIEELTDPNKDKIATRYKRIQRLVNECFNIIERYSHGTADPARTLWQINDKLGRMYYPEEEKPVEEPINEN